MPAPRVRRRSTPVTLPVRVSAGNHQKINVWMPDRQVKTGHHERATETGEFYLVPSSVRKEDSGRIQRRLGKGVRGVSGFRCTTCDHNMRVVNDLATHDS
jgi:hypothetical protein